MILHEFRIPYKYGQEFKLKPGFDWHVGHKYCDKRALRKYLNEDADNPNCYIVTGGDIADSIIVSDKRYVKGSDGSKTQAILNEQTDELIDLLEPYRGRIIGFGHGNHEETVLRRSSYHIGRSLAKHFKTKSLGYQWIIRVVFYEKGSRGRTLLIFGQHGWGGGGRTAGASITKYAKHATGYGADIYLYGHDHKMESYKSARMVVRGKKIVDHPRRIYFPGTFLKTFGDTDEPTWAETRGFHPCAIGGIDIKLKPDGRWITIDGE